MILIAFISVISISIVFLNKSSLTPSIDENSIEGWVIDAYDAGIKYQNYSIWSVSLAKDIQDVTNSTTYMMYFTHDMQAPPENLELRFFYNINGDYYEVHRIISL